MFKKKSNPKEIDPRSMSKAASAYLNVVMEWHEREFGNGVTAAELLGVSVQVLSNVVRDMAEEAQKEHQEKK